MSKINDTLQRRNYLTYFELHLKRAKPYTTKEEVLTKMRNKQCIFTGLLGHFKGDTVFREMRQYCKQHCKERDLIHSMLTILSETYEAA
jgi:hypothetical protein